MKRSAKWITDQKFPSSGFSIPFIDLRGKFTGSNCYRADMNPAGIIATTFATVFRRLKSWTLSRKSNNKRKAVKYQHLLAQCAAYYTVSKNSYFWDRILFLTKDIVKNRKAITGLVFSFAHKLDAHKWFVYGHVCLQTKWLTSRALRPRDKSCLKRGFCTPSVYNGRSTKTPMIFEYDAIWSVCSTLTSLA